MSNEISWMLELDVREGREEALRTLMAEMVDATRANEPDTLAYVWNFTGDGRTCHLYERYADSAAVLTHLGTFGARFASRFFDALQPTRFTVYGSPTAAARDALAGLNPVYMAPAAGFQRDAERLARYAPG